MFQTRWEQTGLVKQGVTIAEMFKVLESEEQLLMFNRLLKGIDEAVRKEIKFAKSIPGFKELSLEDQVSLCKGGSVVNLESVDYHHHLFQISCS